MHPLMLGRARFAIYLAVWLGVGALLGVLLVLLEPRPYATVAAFIAPLTLAYAFVCLSAWWVCRTHPIGRQRPVRLAIGLLTAAVQSSVAWVAAAWAWGMLLTRGGSARMGTPSDLLILAIAGLVLYGQSLAVHYVLIAIESAQAAERRVLESHVGAREAELRALRAQIHPHFLFNSLNSISALTGPDPEAARRMCQLLGDFLRLSLSLGAQERVPLADEMSLAERYLTIEQVRFTDRLAVETAIDPEAGDCLVPPLLVQPLVENAVKHGVADRVEGGTVKITARRRGDALDIVVENPRDPAAPPRRGSGLGLDNVRKRLVALDPERTRMEVLREPERFRVTLTLPAIVSEEARRA